MNFGDLRSLLHKPASSKSWWRICEFLAALEHEQDIEQALDYALPILERGWDSKVRTVPPDWRPAYLDPSGRTIEDTTDTPHTVRTIPVERLAKLFTNVTCADFKYQGFHLAKFFHHNAFPSLRHLNMEGALQDTEAPFFPRIVEHIAACPRLESLHIAGLFSGMRNREHRLDRLTTLVEHLSNQGTRLRSLDLSLNLLDADMLHGVLEQPALHDLEHLALARNEFEPDDDFIKQLSKLPLATSLQTLDLSHNNADPALAEALCFPKAFPSLTHLWFARDDEAASTPPLSPSKRESGMALTILDTSPLGDERNTIQEVRASPREAARLREKPENPRTIITKESQIRLGRSSSACDILLQGSGVSKIHALLVQHGDTIFLRDLQSTNGVRYMSGENIPAGFIKLAPYEKVRIQTFQLHARPHHANAFTEER